jgi:hypothetical protein
MPSSSSRRDIAHPAKGVLGLDLYAPLALSAAEALVGNASAWNGLWHRWRSSHEAAKRSRIQLSRQLCLPDLLTAYPCAWLEITPHGVLLKPS